MSFSPIKAIEHTVQLTHEWLNELCELLDWPDHQRAYRLLRVTLQTLRDRLDVNEAAHLGAQLPILIRGLYFEGWHPAKTPAHDRRLDNFLARIDNAFKNDPLEDTPAAVSAVFALLSARISDGEVKDVRERLPKHLRELWYERGRPHSRT